MSATLFLLGCSPEQSEHVISSNESDIQQEDEGPGDRQLDCGNLITNEDLDQYIDSVRLSVNSGTDEALRDEKLFAANVTLIEDAQITRINRDRLEAYPGSLPSLQDWRMIQSALTAGSLGSGGWRGCFLSSGKAAFEADSKGNVGLSSFDFDRNWELR